MEEAHQRVRNILSERRQVLDDLARLLSEKEIVQGQELRDMLAESQPETIARNPSDPLSEPEGTTVSTMHTGQRS